MLIEIAEYGTNYIGESLYIPVYGGKLTSVLRIGRVVLV